MDEMFEIFDISLTDQYIFALDFADRFKLANEAYEAWFDFEDELDKLMWPDSSKIVGFHEFDPAPPSAYSYDQSLYEPNITSDPSYAIKLGKAEELKSLCGAARAIYETAELSRKGTEDEGR